MIGKTRQPLEQHHDDGAGKARGIVNPAAPLTGKMKHTRRVPPADLAPWISHYWTDAWDLRGVAPHTVATVPHPNVHLVFEDKGITVIGVHTSKFPTVLRVFGVKFQPGGFLRSMNAFCRARAPAPDEGVELADRVVTMILDDSTLQTVDQGAERAAMGKRSLQRLFSEYWGASPKWVIRRYRWHEALERLHSGGLVNMTVCSRRNLLCRGGDASPEAISIRRT